MYSLCIVPLKFFFRNINKLRRKEVNHNSSTFIFDLEYLAADKRCGAMNQIKLMLVRDLLLKEIHRGSFYPVYQPLYNSLSERIYGAEVLSRMLPVNQQAISPVVFIPLLEKARLIGVFGDWILERSMKDVGQWIENGLVDDDFLLSVNVSAMQLEDDGFYSRINRYIKENKLHPKNIQIEITETKRIKCLGAVDSQITRIKNIGITVALDDFGTGYSNIIYLNKLNIDYVKIDKEFLLNIDNKKKRDTLIYSIISMARILGIRTICEGVETIEQRDFLQDAGCFHHQGMLVSMPVSGHDFLSQYKESNSLICDV
jgi:EAL domain-containing protein (putative c-di-GMP-specific phosphodiesterase class I)